MTLKDFIQNEIFDLPLDSNDYFPENISALFDSYLLLLESIDDEYRDAIQSELPDVKSTIETINTIIDLVFKGNTAGAYAIFATLIEKLEPHLVYPNKNLQLSSPSYLFKARKLFERDFGLQDMFHVPFEKRYYISSNRFSLPGVPCLYLSNTIYACWEELDRPIFQQMAVSRFEIKQGNFKFLDLQNTAVAIRTFLNYPPVKIPSGLKKEDAENIEKAENSFKTLVDLLLPRFINAFPLIAVSYLKVLDRSAHFKPEYVFPQMIMQWVMTKDDIDGVKYISTKFKRSKDRLHNLEELINYAIPVKTYAKTGYCQTIAETFSLTKPTSWEMIGLINTSKVTTNLDMQTYISGKTVTPNIFFISVNGEPVQYCNTAFGKLEHELSQMPAYKISDRLEHESS